MEGHSCGPCYFHPGEYAVGVCAACLTEKLLVLAARRSHGGAYSRSPSLKPKVFAMGTSILHRLESRHRNRKIGEDYSSAVGSVHSADESFISIKFEENGQACWDKKAATPVVGAGRRGGARWRKRVLHLLHLVRWRRPEKTGGAAEKGGWIRSLTRRANTE